MTSQEPSRFETLEIYKLFVETTDRVSARRAAANSFFVTLQTALIGVIAGTVEKSDSGALRLGLLAVSVALAALWMMQLRSYRLLNSAKFKVIRELENDLLYRPYAQEWAHLTGGDTSKRKQYVRLSKIEQGIPVVFGLIAIVLYILGLAK